MSGVLDWLTRAYKTKVVNTMLGRTANAALPPEGTRPLRLRRGEKFPT